MREVIVMLPDVIEINGAKEAPTSIRTVKTDKFESDFIVECISHALSQKIGDPLSNKKNLDRVANATRVHENLEKGVWASKTRSGNVTEAKLLEAVGKIDIAKLLAALTPEQHAAILAAGGDISVVTIPSK
jgi:hypothetical protein